MHQRSSIGDGRFIPTSSDVTNQWPGLVSRRCWAGPLTSTNSIWDGGTHRVPFPSDIQRSSDISVLTYYPNLLSTLHETKRMVATIQHVQHMQNFECWHWSNCLQIMHCKA
ncbi:hypothetical protein TNCV_4355931 [Trichonephila clavipes]|nr:hypothetical protein TNCV_4355931 [Trichonephila clavipes]